jgi:hypothetical protein
LIMKRHFLALIIKKNRSNLKLIFKSKMNIKIGIKVV